MSNEAPAINNEAAFLAAMGINPGQVKAGTVGIEFIGGAPMINFVLLYPTTWEMLTRAIAAGAVGAMPGPRPVPEDHKEPAKKAARKAPAKKTAAKK